MEKGKDIGLGYILVRGWGWGEGFSAQTGTCGAWVSYQQQGKELGAVSLACPHVQQEKDVNSEI